MTNSTSIAVPSAAPSLVYGWDEWLFTIYEYYTPHTKHPHYLPYLRPYEATSLWPSVASGSGIEVQRTVDEHMAHMRYLRPDEFEREQEARLAEYARMALEEMARYDARMCVYGYPGRTFEVEEFLRLPHGPSVRCLRRGSPDGERYWFAFMQEISELEEVMHACGPTIVPDRDEGEVLLLRNLAGFFHACRRRVRLVRWACCDVAIPAHHFNAPNAFLIFVRERLEAGYFFRPGATLEENRALLLEYGILVDEYLYYEELSNKAQVLTAIEQGGAAADGARQLWEEAIKRGERRYPRGTSFPQAIYEDPFWRLV
jgi:hypothetical protein